jgi:aryl-phospho-beta-D-glucosidase BglC (GH1 family)
MYETTKEETYNFWRTVSRHYAGHNTVVFYELFNEPTTFRNQLGPVSWEAWKKSVEELIILIRANNPQAIPLVAGFDWAYDLTPLLLSPIAAEGIAYTTHPYANKRSQPWEPKWEVDFGFAAEKYPVIATEFGGLAAPGASSQGAPGESARRPNAEYGTAIIQYLENKGISWVVWCFDPEWGPTLIRNWNYDLTPSGEFAKAAMQRDNR